MMLLGVENRNPHLGLEGGWCEWIAPSSPSWAPRLYNADQSGHGTRRGPATFEGTTLPAVRYWRAWRAGDRGGTTLLAELATPAPKADAVSPTPDVLRLADRATRWWPPEVKHTRACAGAVGRTLLRGRTCITADPPPQESGRLVRTPVARLGHTPYSWCAKQGG